MFLEPETQFKEYYGNTQRAHAWQKLCCCHMHTINTIWAGRSYLAKLDTETSHMLETSHMPHTDRGNVLAGAR